jgi:Lrp/AsnC family transcriptional regulator for asnA, asnC and gidA
MARRRIPTSFAGGRDGLRQRDPAPHAAEGRRTAYDSTDWRIVALLQRNGRLPNTQIAHELNLAEATVRRRIDRLIASGLLKIVAVPSPELAGLAVSAIIGISCELKNLTQTADRIVRFPEVRYVGLSTGPFDLVVEAFFSSHHHLLDFLTTKLAATPGITKTDTAVILKVAKFSFEWELPLEGAAEVGPELNG